MKFDIDKLIAELTKQLVSVCENQNTATQESWWLLEELTKKQKAEILEDNEIVLDQTQQNTLEQWINQRVKHHKPLQYILGHVPFCNTDILVEPPVLIPRPETEYMVAQTIAQLQPLKNESFSVLDMGTGSGCIAIAFAKAFPKARIFGIDINEKAIDLSEKNKTHNHVNNVTFVYDTFEINNNILNTKTFDIIISNPPYVKEKEWENLSDIVKNWEDKKALVAHNSGLQAFQIIINTATHLLTKQSICSTYQLPQIILEMGMGQEEEVKKFLIESNFKNIKIFRDLRGVNRWITASL